MILEIDTSLLTKVNNISINQLVFLNLVLDNHQKNHQDVAAVVSLVSDNEIQDLINRNLIIKNVKPKSVSFKASETLTNIINGSKSFFDEFKEIYPKVVIRPDGTNGFLHSNTKKCRELYNKIVKNDYLLHQKIKACLECEMHDKLITGKMGYMKTMWKWITNSEWEVYEERIEEPAPKQTYGTELL